MKVAINGDVLLRGRSGTATGIRAIEAAAQSSFATVTLSRGGLGGTRITRLAGSVRWDFQQFARQARDEEASVAVLPANTGITSGIPSILVMHDAMVLKYPQLFDAGYQCYAKLAFRVSARLAKHVVTPSVHSLNQLRAYLDIQDADVIPWPAPPRAAAPPLFEVRQPTLLTIAPSASHKRLHVAVAAVSMARQLGGIDYKLLMIGRKGTGEGLLTEAINKYDPRNSWITRTQLLDEVSLRRLIATSLALVIPSLDEGYGLPAAEAAALGTPSLHLGGGALAEYFPMSSSIDSEPTGPPERRLAVMICRASDKQTWLLGQTSGYFAIDRLSGSRFTESWCQLLTAVAAQ